MSRGQRARSDSIGPPPRFEGLRNFRDLGGLPGDAGRRIIPGRLFRSAVLSRLTASDVSAFKTLGVGDIFDLRLPGEVELHRTVDLSGVTIRNYALRVIDLDRVFAAAVAEPAQLTPQCAARVVEDGYASSLSLMASQFRDLFSVLAADGTGGALVHCMTGKDRTGVVIALLLAALGVDRERIVGDYTETARNISAEKLTEALARHLEAEAGRPADRAILYPLFEARPSYIGAMLDHLSTGFGGVDNYFRGPLGLPASVLESLRQRFLHEPPGGDAAP